MYEYKIHPRFAKHPALIRTVNGKAVNLKDEPIKKIVPATRKDSAYEVIIPAATQEELKAVWEEQQDKKKYPISTEIVIRVEKRVKKEKKTDE